MSAWRDALPPELRRKTKAQLTGKVLGHAIAGSMMWFARATVVVFTLKLWDVI